ncbi:hypothetical protein [Haloplanus halophilus]|uniref:hypothetical protein n=1 Tax=Haloplanus halophilus TaxID=2949993 RepID=UPI00203AA811|nr:hypothetical protein [Haloplanus sp. GDY1]
MSRVDEVWDHLVSQYGDALRAVTKFRNGEFETRMRDDVRNLYTDREDQRVVDEITLGQLHSQRLENEFKCGQLTGTVHIFGEAFVAVQTDPTARKTGYLVTFDRRGDVTIADLDDCFEYLRTVIL